MKKLVFLLFSLVFLLFSGKALAEEIIDDFSANIRIYQDATVWVEEKITYNFNELERHGIFRNIPLGEAGFNKKTIKISEIKVSDADGNGLPFEIQKEKYLLKIKIGDPNATVSGQKVYVISYKVSQAINFLENQEEFYWNITGQEWPSVISHSQANIYLPVQLPADRINFTCFAGYYGSSEKCQAANLIITDQQMVGGVYFENGSLPAKAGLTVALSLPKGFIQKPELSFWDVFRQYSPLALPFLALAICFYFWKKFGRDERGRQTIVTQFDAPDKLTPLEVGTILDFRVDTKDLSSEIIYLATLGYLKINRLAKDGIFGKDDYQLNKLKSGEDLSNEFDKLLMDSLFKSGEEVRLSKLKKDFYVKARKITKKAQSGLLDKGYFKKNASKVSLPFVITGMVFLGLTVIADLGLFSLATLSLIASGLIFLIFSFLMPARTLKGVLAKEHILGLKEYIRVAEVDRIKFHNAPEKNPQLFEKLLPFAMVLGLEKAWAKQFEGIYEQSPSWYSDYSHGTFNAVLLTSSLSDFKSTASASLFATASQGGSGFSGGAGGGFGGGGGGSW